MNINDYNVIDDKYKNIPGVYMIYNTYNGSFYIGSSINLYRRAYHHKYELINNKHPNKYLSHSFNKYGIKAFIFIVLKIEDTDNLLSCEQYYMDTLNPKYNMEKKTKGSYYDTGKKSVNRGKKRMKPVLQWRLDGTFVKKWDCIKYATLSFGCETGAQLYNCLYGAGKTAFGYCWSLDNNIPDFKKMGNTYGRRLTVINPFGEIIGTFLSITKASIFLNIKRQTLDSITKGTRKNAKYLKGYKFIIGEKTSNIIADANDLFSEEIEEDEEL